MGQITDDAIAILRYLVKKGAIGGKGETRRTIREALRLSEERYFQAETYLIGAKYVSGTLGGDSGHIWLTSLGVATLEKANDNDSFWKRKKDEILVGLISALVSFILGLISGLILAP